MTWLKGSVLWAEAGEPTSHDCLANVQAAIDVLPQGALKGQAVVWPLVAPMHRAGGLHRSAGAFSSCAPLLSQR